MRVEVENITDKELELSEDIDASLWDLDSYDIQFINTIHLEAVFVRAGTEILVRGKVDAHRRITCSRCLSSADQEIVNDFTLSYPIASLAEYLEIDKDVREEILLNFPMKVLCTPTCKGLCPHCGSNLNNEECQCKHTKIQEE